MVHKQLIEKLISCSESKDYYHSVEEWEITDFNQEENSECVCGTGITDCYTITNKINGNVLHPIGNICIKKFDSEQLNRQMKKFKTVECVCGLILCNNQAYKNHLNSRKHIFYLGTKKCLGCEERIKNTEPEWKKRCFKCYKINKK